MTGSIPGIAASTSDTCELGAAPKPVAAPENSLACEFTWAWISMPTTTSQSPVAPLISFEVLTGEDLVGASIIVPWASLRHGAGIARSADAVKGRDAGPAH